MSLKFSCPYCSYEIISDYLKSGDMLRCPECGNIVAVPANAEATEQRGNIINYLPPPEPQPNFEEHALSPEPPPVPTMWGIRDILKFVLYNYLCEFTLIIGLAIFCAIVIGFSGNPGPAWVLDWDEPYQSYFWYLSGLLIDAISIWLIYYFVVTKHHNSFTDALKLKNISKNQIIFFFAPGPAIILLSLLLKDIMWRTPIKNIGSEYHSENIFQYGYYYAILRSITPLIAAFVEEVIFRGFLFSGLKKSLGQSWAAIIVSILFIASHGSRVVFDPIYLAGHILFAAVVIWIRIRTDSVTNTIVIHFSNNLIVGIIKWARYLA